MISINKLINIWIPIRLKKEFPWRARFNYRANLLFAQVLLTIIYTLLFILELFILIPVWAYCSVLLGIDKRYKEFYGCEEID